MTPKEYKKPIGPRIIDMLGEASLQIVSKFGQVNVDWRTNKRHFHKHQVLKTNHGRN